MAQTTLFVFFYIAAVFPRVDTSRDDDAHMGVSIRSRIFEKIHTERKNKSQATAAAIERKNKSQPTAPGGLYGYPEEADDGLTAADLEQAVAPRRVKATAVPQRDAMTVTCPDDKLPGQLMKVMTPAPHSKLLQVPVPATDDYGNPMRPGGSFTVDYDTNTPAIKTVQAVTPQQFAERNNVPAGGESDLYPMSALVPPTRQKNQRTNTGQDLRGVLDAGGVAWAIKFDKDDCKRAGKNGFFRDKRIRRKKSQGLHKGNGNWFFNSYDTFSTAKVECDVSIKLLRFNPQKKNGGGTAAGKSGHNFPLPIRWNARDETETPKLIHQGWIKAIKIRGWWQDQTSHFEGHAFMSPAVGKKARFFGFNKWEKILAWAFIPWDKVEVRFDADGASFWIQWKSGWSQYTRTFRLDAKPDVPKEELRKIWVSGEQPIRGALVVVSTRMYEWNAPNPKQPDLAEGVLYMRLMDRHRGGSKADKKEIKEIWLKDVPNTALPWAIFNGECGSFKFIIDADKHALQNEGKLLYTVTRQSTSCLSGWSNRENGTDPCPWIDSFFKTYEAKFVRDNLWLRPKDIGQWMSKEVKGGIFSRSVPSRPMKEQAGDLILYPIYDDATLQDGYSGNVLEWSAGGDDSARLSEYGVGFQPEKEEKQEAPPEQYQVAQVAQQVAKENETLSEEQTELLEKLRSRYDTNKRRISSLRDQNKMEQEESARLKTANYQVVSDLVAAQAEASKYGGLEMALEAEEMRMRQQLMEIAGIQIVTLFPGKGVVIKDGQTGKIVHTANYSSIQQKQYDDAASRAYGAPPGNPYGAPPANPYGGNPYGANPYGANPYGAQHANQWGYHGF